MSKRITLTDQDRVALYCLLKEEKSSWSDSTTELAARLMEKIGWPEGEGADMMFLPEDWPTGASVDYNLERLAAA